MTSLDKNKIVIGKICNNIEPGKKMLQKLMYLISRKGVNLNLNYSIHFFGPYSAKLDNVLHAMENYDMVSIDTSGQTHSIHLGSVPIEGELEAKDQEIVDYIMTTFASKSAYELEAITTLDYVFSFLLSGHATDAEVINKVEQIKGSKFTSAFLADSFKILKEKIYQ